MAIAVGRAPPAERRICAWTSISRALPDDVDDAASAGARAGGAGGRRRCELAEAQAEIERLRLMVRRLQRTQFGRRSEQLDDDQLQLGLEDLDADIARAEAACRTPAAARVPAPMGDGTSLPDHLPRENVAIDIEARSVPAAAALSMRSARPSARCWTMCRRACGCCASAGPSTAAAPAARSTRRRRLSGRSPRALASPALLAHVLVSKYCDHLPLYRQAQIFARQGVEIDRSTLANWVGGACWWLEPLQARLAEHVFASGKLFADDTPIPVLDPGRGRTKTGRLWVYARDDRPWGGSDPPAAVYFYSADRKAERPAAHLAGFRGVLQVDGYAGFERLTARGDIVLAACWAHARRKFYDVHAGDRLADRRGGAAPHRCALCHRGRPSGAAPPKSASTCAKLQSDRWSRR